MYKKIERRNSSIIKIETVNIQLSVKDRKHRQKKNREIDLNTMLYYTH